MLMLLTAFNAFYRYSLTVNQYCIMKGSVWDPYTLNTDQNPYLDPGLWLNDQEDVGNDQKDVGNDQKDVQ